MCQIEEVPGFRLNGRLYDTPLAALSAGLGEIATDIQRNHAGSVLQGLLKHGDALVYLLPLYAKEVAPVDQPERTLTAQPEKDPLPEDVYWSPEHGNFYARKGSKGMGRAFYDQWKTRHADFPTAPFPPADED